MALKERKLSREEKISQFDELRKNYCALMKSLKLYEQECSKLTKTNIEKEVKSTVKVELREHGDVIKRENQSIKTKKKPGNWKDDPDLPHGWKYAEHFYQRTPSSIKTYLSPRGRIFQGIAYVLKEFLDNGEGIDPLMKYLKKEGWFETDLLPPGHLMKQKPSEKGFYYLTAKAEKFTTTVRMVKYLREEIKWDEKLVERFLTEHKSLYSDEVLVRKPLTVIKLEQNNSSGLQWQPDIFLPDGWKVALTKHKNGSEVKRYMSPEGELLGNLSKALKHILLNGIVSDEQMEILKDGLEYDGWGKETKLPDGWRVKRESNSESFLSPDLDFFSSRNDLNKFLEKCGQKSDTENHNSKNDNNVDKRSDKKLGVPTINGWKSDPLLPEGWMSCWFAGKENDTNNYKKFKSPIGKNLNSRALAMKDINQSILYSG